MGGAATRKLSLELQGTSAGRRQRTNAVIHCSLVIKQHKLCNRNLLARIGRAGKFNVEVRQIGDLGSKIMPRMACFHIAGGGRTESTRES